MARYSLPPFTVEYYVDGVDTAQSEELRAQIGQLAGVRECRIGETPVEHNRYSKNSAQYLVSVRSIPYDRKVDETLVQIEALITKTGDQEPWPTILQEDAM